MTAPALELAPAEVDVEPLAGGGMILRLPRPLAPYERHLRAILEENTHRRVRCGALFALASVVQSSSYERQPEAEELYRRFIQQFDGQFEYPNQRIEQTYHQWARTQLDEIASRGIGKPAPQIVGIDLDGQSMKLSDYRGKVVLLSFWATWCYPCMKLIPHERKLAERLADGAFAIVGVNGDKDVQAAREAARRGRGA